MLGVAVGLAERVLHLSHALVQLLQVAHGNELGEQPSVEVLGVAGAGGVVVRVALVLSKEPPNRSR